MNLRKTARLVAQFYDQKLQPSGLKTTQFTLLVSLSFLAPVSISLLADRMGMDRTTLTRNLRLLEREGLVSGQHDGQDARVRLLSLTSKGEATIAETQPYWEAAQTEFLNKFGKDRWQRLQGELSDITACLPKVGTGFGIKTRARTMT